MPGLNPEQQARQHIDTKLAGAGWSVQDYHRYNPSAGLGVAFCEVPLASGTCDHVLLMGRTPCIGDLRTNQHFTLKENTLKRSDLDDFVACYNPKNRFNRKETERFKSFTYADLLKRDKVNLDIFWLKDDSLEDSANLPAPGIIAAEIVEDLEEALEEFRAMEEDLK